MKKLFAVLMAILMVFSLTACGGGNEEEKETIDIAMVTDVGQLNDGGFNQYTFEGVKQYCEANSLKYKYFQPANGADATDDDRIAAMHQAIEMGAQVIVLPGYLQEGALTTVATENPEVKFVWVDGWTFGLNNITAISYKEEQSGYLAGYAATKDGYTSLGFTGGGGGKNAAVNRFAYGYVQGIEAAAAELDVTVDAVVSFKYGDGFAPSNELQTQISGWYSNGTQVVFSCGGGMLQSVKAAAAENPDVRIIGVDVDQSGECDQVITSATKNLAGSVVYTLTKNADGKWDSELANVTSKLGAVEDGVGLPMGTSRFNTFSTAEYDAMFADIKAGNLVVDDKAGDDMSSADKWADLVARCPHVNFSFE